MNLVRPPTVDAALQACTRRPLSAAYRSSLQRRTIPSNTIRRKWISDGSRPPLPPGATVKTQVVAPKTRMAVGVVFIGALIYSMVTGEKSATEPLGPPNVPPAEDQEPPPSSDGSTLPDQNFPPKRPSSSQLLDSPASLAEKDTLAKQESNVNDSSPMRLRMEKFIHENQDEIVRQLEKVDGKKFQKDEWNRPKGGGGITCVLQDGNVFEKAGVNTSVVYGTLPRAAIAKMRVHHKALDAEVESLEFFAAGISLVLHPKNPHAPTVHLNYRYFETENPGGGTGAGTWWFGGGTDLTPSILYEEDAKSFHRGIKDACDKHDKTYYTRFKAWCDKYFYIPHRNETRGIGGIFFDDLDSSTLHNTNPIEAQDHLFHYIQSCLSSFLPTYLPILTARKDTPFTEQQKHWQQLRRGRYVEFNLVHDRGTAFGLNTPGARVESILMSLPLTARWEYVGDGDIVEQFEGSGPQVAEIAALMKVLRSPREWV